jgi:CAP-Gly domain-containing linker protein 1
VPRKFKARCDRLKLTKAEGLRQRHRPRRRAHTGYRYREFPHDVPLSWHLWSLRRMAYTPSSSTASRGRIPTPSRSSAAGSGIGSGIPTPGRSRAGSTVNAATNTSVEESPGMSRALSDAIRANDPRQHRATSRPSDQSLSPNSSPSSQSGKLQQGQSGRKSVARPADIVTARTPSAASSSTSSAPLRAPQPKTPTSTRTGGLSYTPRASSSTNASSRSESRQSEVRGKGNGKDRIFEPGDAVRIESLGMEGTLRFMGSIEGKPGVWAGVELAPGFAGRGKNDGAVNGYDLFIYRRVKTYKYV